MSNAPLPNTAVGVPPGPQRLGRPFQIEVRHG